MKIILGEKNVVVQGMTMEENSWGKYQFPTIFYDGEKLIARVHTGMDDWADFDKSNERWFYSTDEGKTWTEGGEELRDASAVTLPNGDKLSFVPRPGKDVYHYKEKVKDLYELLPSDKLEKAEPGSLPACAGWYSQWVYPLKFSTYDSELIPDELRDDVYFAQKRIKAGETESKEEKGEIIWPHMPFNVMWVDIEEKATVCPANGGAGGKVKVAPDGALWMTVHSAGDLDENNGAYLKYSSTVLLVSEDNGKTWKFRSKVKYVPDTSENIHAVCEGGFNESTYEFMSDGSVIMLMRCNDVCHGSKSWSPMYITRSTDNGYTWEKPKLFSQVGVLPGSCRLDCGATLAIYGRPGIFVRGTKDPSGMEWEDEVVVMTPEDRSHLGNTKIEGRPTFHQWVGSCCNCDIVAISENKAVIIYSDFYYPDETGLKRKTIITQTVTVEMG